MPNQNRRWQRLFAPDAQKEIEGELRFHLEERVRDYRARGRDEQSARAAARARLGDLASVQQECTELLQAEVRAGSGTITDRFGVGTDFTALAWKRRTREGDSVRGDRAAREVWHRDRHVDVAHRGRAA